MTSEIFLISVFFAWLIWKAFSKSFEAVKNSTLPDYEKLLKEHIKIKTTTQGRTKEDALKKIESNECIAQGVLTKKYYNEGQYASWFLDVQIETDVTFKSLGFPDEATNKTLHCQINCADSDGIRKSKEVESLKIGDIVRLRGRFNYANHSYPEWYSLDNASLIRS